MAIKCRRIPLRDSDIPRDLIDAYFEAKRRALDVILSHVRTSVNGKVHLRFDNIDRKRLRDELLTGWKFSKHYVDAAINSVMGLVKAWITRYNRGLAEKRPMITKRTVYIKNTLFSLRDGVLRISIEPGKRYLDVNLDDYPWLPKVFDRVGGLILNEKELAICFKKDVELKACRWAAIDINLGNIIMVVVDGDDVVVKRYGVGELQKIHNVYEEKRRVLQSLKTTAPKRSERILEKYRRREKDRANNFLHQLTSRIVKELVGCGVIMEDLRMIKTRILNRSSEENRKLSKWGVRAFQNMLEYKLKWRGLPTIYVNPSNTSRICPLCSGRISPHEGRLVKCSGCNMTADRDVVAVVNIYRRARELPRHLVMRILETEPIFETIMTRRPKAEKKLEKLQKILAAE